MCMSKPHSPRIPRTPPPSPPQEVAEVVLGDEKSRNPSRRKTTGLARFQVPVTPQGLTGVKATGQQ